VFTLDNVNSSKNKVRMNWRGYAHGLACSKKLIFPNRVNEVFSL